MRDIQLLSEEQLHTMATMLSRLQPGVLPLPIFHAITRLVATPIVEIVPLRRNQNNKIEVLLLKREPADPIWPGQLHVPGTVIRASDSESNFADAFKRILLGELEGIPATTPTFVKNILHKQGRGMEASQIYWVEVQGKPTVGKFYDVDQLPKTLVTTQLNFIPAAVAHYKLLLSNEHLSKVDAT